MCGTPLSKKRWRGGFSEVCAVVGVSPAGWCSYGSITYIIKHSIICLLPGLNGRTHSSLSSK
jgi:hypothetical protein